jgi:hypothetical protein
MMLRTSRWILLVLAAALAAGCSQAVLEATDEPAAVVEPIAGTDIQKVTLTEEAATRIGLETAAVSADASGQAVVPSAAVIYDANGATWVYTNPDGLEFVRVSITVAAIDGSDAVITQGPSTGTRVVIVGVAELYGTEFGVGEPG